MLIFENHWITSKEKSIGLQARCFSLGKTSSKVRKSSFPEKEGPNRSFWAGSLLRIWEVKQQKTIEVLFRRYKWEAQIRGSKIWGRKLYNRFYWTTPKRNLKHLDYKTWWSKSAMRIDIRCTTRSPFSPMQLQILCLGVLRCSFPASRFDKTLWVLLRIN